MVSPSEPSCRTSRARGSPYAVAREALKKGEIALEDNYEGLRRPRRLYGVDGNLLVEDFRRARDGP